MPKLYAGLDVGDRTTAVCIIDEMGEILFEAMCDTSPDVIALTLKPYKRRLKLVGQEAGGKAAWLHRGLEAAKFPIRSLDPRHAHAALKARHNKTDANDALGIATLLARGKFVEAYIKRDETLRIKVLLSLRRTLLRKAVDLNLAVGMARKLLGTERPLANQGRKWVQGDDEVDSAFACIARVSEAAKAEVRTLDSVISDVVNESAICRRLMTVPGVGAITALTFMAAIDDPARFRSSRDVGPYFGLCPRTFQSGGAVRSGSISHRGDRDVRKALYLAAVVLLTHSRTSCSLKQWGLRIKAAKGHKLACTAVARKLAILLHHLWVSEQDFDPNR